MGDQQPGLNSAAAMEQSSPSRVSNAAPMERELERIKWQKVENGTKRATAAAATTMV